MAATLCPCSSGRRYSECCAPFHKGLKEAPTPSELMRSRYSAFALKQVDYLWRTLHPDHPDRRRPEDEVKRELRKAFSTFKYPGLKILDAAGPGEDGAAYVLFHAQVFEKGRDRSFVERSEFRHDGTGWRYLAGELRVPRELGTFS
ncbi:MAG: YchJ family metal-binding protein [Myxococcaceae bacterium]